MSIILFKLLITPFFIASTTLAGRRWGPVVNGLLVGLPLTTGPISFILAHQYGLAFAARAAAGNLAGQISMCVFCLTYSRLAFKTGWRLSAPIALAAFLTTTAVLNRAVWPLGLAGLALLLAIALAARAIPQRNVVRQAAAPPRWDLPARMAVATAFVILLTAFAQALGPQLSGLISTFPIFGVVFAAFTHSQHGPQAAANLLRGIVLGSLAYACFFLTIGLGLIPLGIPAAYTLAILAALLVSGLFYVLTQREARRLSAP